MLNGDEDFAFLAPTPPEWQWPNHLPEWEFLLRGAEIDHQTTYIVLWEWDEEWRLVIDGSNFSTSGPARADGPGGNYIINGQTVTVTAAPNAWDGS
jgi:hypothetical protein